MHSAPAKIILFGEHAVVYGQPAIAVPFNTLSATAEATPTPTGTGLTIIARDLGAMLHVEPDQVGATIPENALVYAAQLTLSRLGMPMPNLSIEVRSTIPIASGFGSGAAISAAIIRELSVAVGAPLDGDPLNALVYEVEKLYHGTPSGIDNTVIVKNAPIYFVRGQEPESFKIGAALTFVIADSGIQASTRETVGAVRALYEQEPTTYQGYFDEIGVLVREARQSIEQGDLAHIGQLMTRNHELLTLLTVSSPPLNALTSAAETAGALGAKLSGGGRGGNVIALVEAKDAQRITHAFKGAGAAHTWITTLDPR